MVDNSAQVDIPKRALFKAAEVCDLVGVQPYVLCSWEAEFPDLGVAKMAGGPRVYRRADVEQVARIKRLLLIEGLTLAGVRRRLEEEATPITTDAPLEELIGRNAGERLTEVRRGLRAILELLAGRHSRQEFPPSAPAAVSRARPMPVGHVKPSHGKASTSRTGAAMRRKRSA